MKLDAGFLDSLMAKALQEARQAAAHGEVPVGAVLARGSDVVVSARNEMEVRNDATAHAEVLAIRRASQYLGNWRLSDCILCVSLEPCTMCMGAIRLARVPVVVYGARDARMGAVGSLYDLSLDSRMGEGPRIISGVREAEASEILTEFFRQKRDNRVEVLQ